MYLYHYNYCIVMTEKIEQSFLMIILLTCCFSICSGIAKCVVDSRYIAATILGYSHHHG